MNDIFKPMLELAEVKTFQSFSKGVRCVRIEYDGACWAFSPTINLGAKGGFEDLNKKIIRVISSETAGLGKALLSALYISE